MLVLEILITLNLGETDCVVLLVVEFGVSLDPTTTTLVKFPDLIVLKLTVKLASFPISYRFQ